MNRFAVCVLAVLPAAAAAPSWVDFFTGDRGSKGVRSRYASGSVHRQMFVSRSAITRFAAWLGHTSHPAVLPLPLAHVEKPSHPRQAESAVRWEAPSFCHGLACPEYQVVNKSVSHRKHNFPQQCPSSAPCAIIRYRLSPQHAYSISQVPLKRLTIAASQDGFEIRHYEPSVWVSTKITDVSYDDATNVGFHRLFDYISGNNDAATKIPMTARDGKLTPFHPSAGH